VIGASWHPFKSDWTTEAPHLLSTTTFTKSCSWKPSDKFVYHAVGENGSRVVAIGSVLSACRHEPRIDGQFGFEFACDVEIVVKRRLIAEGLPLEELNVDGRDLRRSVARHSHIRLRPEEFERAKLLLTV
jgi:hypothetical protein